jgi:hypothetical protein
MQDICSLHCHFILGVHSQLLVELLKVRIEFVRVAIQLCVERDYSF